VAILARATPTRCARTATNAEIWRDVHTIDSLIAAAVRIGRRGGSAGAWSTRYVHETTMPEFRRCALPIRNVKRALGSPLDFFTSN